MSIFAIAAGIPDDIGAGYPLGPFFSSIAELVPARSRAARTRRSARRYALPQRPDDGKHLSQTSHYVGRPRPPQGPWGPTIFFGRSSAALLLRRWRPPKKIVTPTAPHAVPWRSLTRPRPPDPPLLSFTTIGRAHV